MNISTILLVIVILVFGYYIYVTFFKPKGKQSLFESRKANKALRLSDVYPSEVRSSYAHAFWILVNTMDNNNNADNRNILIKSDGKNDIEFQAYLEKYSNNLVIETTTMSKPETAAAATTETMTCKVSNIPLQKWVSVVLSVQDRALDVYIDGKLVRTCVSKNNLHLISKPVLDVTTYKNGAALGDGGFSGYINKLEYYNSALTPNEAYSIYRKGPGSGKFNMNYNVKLSLLKNDDELKSYQF